MTSKCTQTISIYSQGNERRTKLLQLPLHGTGHGPKIAGNQDSERYDRLSNTFPNRREHVILQGRLFFFSNRNISDDYWSLTTIESHFLGSLVEKGSRRKHVFTHCLCKGLISRASGVCRMGELKESIKP